MPANATLVKAAMELRAGEPEMWAGFVGVMREYANDVRDEMIRCPAEMLLRAQGMAIMANEIASVLEDAPTLYEKMQNTILGRDHGRNTNR